MSVLTTESTSEPIHSPEPSEKQRELSAHAENGAGVVDDGRAQPHDGDSNDGDDDDEGEGEDEDDEDDEAEAIARRLGDQLWADINKAHADRATSASNAQRLRPSQEVVPTANKCQAAIATMKTILAFAAADSQVYATLSGTPVPGLHGENILDLLKKSVESGTISREAAGPLSQTLVALARSEVLFSPLPTVPAHLQATKRKRDDADDGERAPKRLIHPQQDLQTQLSEAIRVITNTLNIQPAPDKPLDGSLIASIQLQLHQVFLFAVTSSIGQDLTALQEISGLIQVLGVLSGIQITPSLPTPHDQHGDYPARANSAVSWEQNASQPQQFGDIGTAVYPCLLTGCRKTFSRLYSLRQHQRAHSVHRPFKCNQCPASFARNHDLKRHVKGHDKRAFRCCGCGKVFSRRDAIKRHKGSSKKGVGCAEAETEEVEVDNQSGDDMREGRRAKMWSGITTTSVGEDGLEEGQLPPGLVAQAQTAVSHLHSLLQGHVANALGTNGIPAVPAGLAGTDSGQATLASVIARATAAANMTAYSYGVIASPPSDPAMASLFSSPPPQAPSAEPTTASLSSYGLNEDQAKLLEQAIASATAAAQAQAEAEAMLEEEEEEDHDDEDDDEDDAKDGEVEAEE